MVMPLELNFLVISAAVGTTVTTTAAILVSLQKWFMPRTDCQSVHSGTDKKFAEEKEKRREIRGMLHNMTCRIYRLDQRLNIYSERQAWLIAGMVSLMEKVGANGVPPPPSLPDPPDDVPPIDEGEDSK